MLLSKIDSNSLTDENINEILFNIPTDDGKTGNCIFVFGCKTWMKERVELAVKLYNEKRAPYILFSGGLGKNGTEKESLKMKEMAISLGVPEDKILTEEYSNNTTENVLCSLVVLERKFLLQNIKRLIIVQTPAYVSRTILTLSRYMPKWIEYSYSYDDNSNVSRKNWKKNIESRNRVEKEAKGIIFYAKNGYIDDKEVDMK